MLYNSFCKEVIMITKLGVFLRKLRLDNNEIMKDMAGKLGVSPSFLSAVENGKKKMPDSWLDSIIDLYDLNEKKQNELLIAIEESKKKVEIALDEFSGSKKRLLLSFARELNGMDERDLEIIKNLLKKGGD